MTVIDAPEKEVGRWVSLLLRLAIGSLFLAASVAKLSGGTEGIRKTVGYFQTTFAPTWLPHALVTAHGWATPFIEALIPLWLILGYRLRTGWILAGLFMISLSFGMVVAQKGDVAAHNYVFVLICCAGLYASRYDRFSIDGLLKRS